jgi:ABC-type multidrug transport system fused ATPase/permease subunit
MNEKGRIRMNNSTFKRISNFSKKYILWILVAAIATLGCTFCDLVLADTLQTIIDNSLSGVGSTFWGLFIKGCILLILTILTNYIMVYMTGYYSTNILKDIRNEAVEHLKKLPIGYFTNNKRGEVIAKLSADAESLQNFMEGSLVDLFYVPIMVLGFSIYMCSLNPKLFLACFISLPILLPINVITMKPIKARSKEYVRLLGKTNNNIQDLIDGIRIVKAYNLEEELLNKYKKDLNVAVDISLKNDKRQYALEPISYLIMNLPVIICLIYGGKLAIEGEITLGAMAAFLSLLKLIIDPLFRGYLLYINSKSALASAERVFSILDTPVEQEAYDNFEKCEYNSENIYSLKNVNFSYSLGQELLKDFNLDILKNKTTAIVGGSGSGKSTLLKLLCGFYPIKNGQIFFGNNPLNNLEKNEYRDKIAYVSQEAYLFPLTIAENIALAVDGKVTKEEIENAAKLANAHDFIIKFPNSYDTMVGERGTLLSGGQIQRLSLARAVLKDAPVIILDEATSALDVESEKLVQAALNNLGTNKTRIVVAHRLSTIENADEILVLEQGKVVEQGKHSDLLKRNGVYYNLYNKERIKL